MSVTVNSTKNHDKFLSQQSPNRTPYCELKRVGGINYRRLLESLGKDDGSTKIDMLKEFIDNSFDSEAKEVLITFDKNNDQIIIQDDGSGMDIHEIGKFFELHSENKYSGSNNTVDGKFGMGVKKACANLSGLKPVEVETKKNGEKNLCAKIDYQKIIDENKYDGSIPISESKDFCENSGTKITINTCEEIISEFENIINKESIKENLQFDLTFTYNPRLLEGKNITIEFLHQNNKKDTYKFTPIDLDDAEFIKKKVDIKLLKAPKSARRRSLIYAYKENNTTDIFRVFTHPFKESTNENITDYQDTGHSCSLELLFPKHTRNPCDRKDGRKNGCFINNASIIPFYENVKERFKLTDSNTELMKHFKDITIQRNQRVLTNLDFDLSKIDSTRDTNSQNEYNCIIKRFCFKSTSDEIIRFAQQTKSQSNWKNAPSGLRDVIGLITKEFVKCEVKSFISKKVCPLLHTENIYYEDECKCKDTNKLVNDNSDKVVNDNSEEQEELVNDNSDEVVNDNSDEVVNDNSDEVVNNDSDEVVNDNSDEVVNNDSDEVVNNDSDEVVNNDSEELVNDVSDEVVNSSDEPVNDNSDEVVNDNSNELVNDNSDEVVNNNSDSNKFFQNNIAYLGVQKVDKYKTEYKSYNNKIRMKIGFTTKSVSERFKGNILTDGFEPVMRFEINEHGGQKFNHNGQSKHQVEIELFEKLIQLEGVEFESGSSEIFLIPYENRFGVDDIFYNECKCFRPS